MNLNEQIVRKLDILVKLNAASFVAEKGFKEQVRILSSMGITPKEISEILGKTANNVRVMLNYIKHSSRRRK